jgi:hypothetical protein
MNDEPPPYGTGEQPEPPQWQQHPNQPPPAQYPPPCQAPPSSYAYPAPPPAYGYVQPSYSNGNAITALVLGILGVTFCFVTAPVAIIFGWLGMRDANRGTSNARGLSIAGFILGIIGTLLIIGVAALFIVAASVDSTTP